jgi:hypothetical protein
MVASPEVFQAGLSAVAGEKPQAYLQKSLFKGD